MGHLVLAVGWGLGRSALSLVWKERGGGDWVTVPQIAVKKGERLRGLSPIAGLQCGWEGREELLKGRQGHRGALHVLTQHLLLQLDPFYASIILFVGRAWDAVTDPMVGFFISKTPWTRLGRLMPW